MPERRIHGLERGGLHGWSADASRESRHEALERSVRAKGYKGTVESLGALRRLDEHRDPHVARVAREDQRWLHRRYRGSGRSSHSEGY